MKRTKFIIFCFFTLLFSSIAVYSQSNSRYSQEEIYEAELAASSNGHASEENATMHSSSYVNWNTQMFSSKVSLDVVKAGIPMPSGKVSSVNRIQMQLPVLIKDPLLSIYVDDQKTLGDLVLEGSLTLEELTRIIDNAKQTPAVFASGTNNLLTEHFIDLKNISALLIKHKTPYTQQRPIDSIATRNYTGIIIDARGLLPVQGEFVESKTSPCLFPRIWNDKMQLMYERNMVNPEIAKESMIVEYGSKTNIKDYKNRTGDSPLWITAKKVYGQNRCDPVISWEDYLRITSNEHNLNLLKEGKIVIILDDDEINHAVTIPERNKNYYLEYQRLRKFFYENEIPEIGIIDSLPGIEISVENLNFIADSKDLLPGELSRIQAIADSLKSITDNGNFTILVEGHTADVNKPNGQLELSIQRAQTIIDILCQAGIDREICSYKGYGGTQPLSSNDTPEGRAQNRRVKITVIPKSTSTQAY